ncbi:MAG: branched-chain amino acid ABC transporter permease/ATP-binding protein [Actinomycetota bacterium]|nr:branched-chain amino acid ABC transporter permease/ATP-binding protein [Actinomycetota bacterium]
MQDVLRFAVLGIGVGAIYAIAAQGLVLIYRGSGILNFAQGALALFAGSTFGELRDGGMSALPAAMVSILITGVIGAAIHLVVMRPLRTSSPLARVVATLGLLGIIQSASILRYGTDMRLVPSFLPTTPVNLTDEIVVSSDRIWLLGISIVLAMVLWAAYRFTTFGIWTSSVAENRRAAGALGISPDLVATANWALGAMLAALAGVLIVPITGLPGNLTLLIVPALAAALVGGFASFPLTLLGGLGLGIAESLLGNYVTKQGWARSAPFLVIVAVLIVRGRSLPVRGHIIEKLPMVGRSLAAGWVRVLLVVLGAVGLGFASEDLAIAATTSLLAAIVCLSIVVVTGLAGQLSLGQYALAGLGAFVASRLADTHGLPFPVAVLAGMVVAVPVGIVFSLPALRTRGLFLAISTLGLALAVEQLILFNRDWTGGFVGTVVDEPTIFGWSVFSITHPNRYAVVVFVVFSLLALGVVNLRGAPSGRRLLATRANERAAASLGISVMGAKVYAFAVGSFIAAAGGALLAFRLPNVRFDQYGVFASMNAVVLTVLGGAGFVTGALIGGALLAGGLVTELLQHTLDLNKWATLITSSALVLMLMWSPDGLARVPAALAARMTRRLRHAAAGLGGSGEPGTWQRCTPRTLAVRDVTVRFGGVSALDEVSLEVAPGHVVGLIGPNGAGKTTLIDAITGYSRPFAGSMHLGDQDLTRMSPAARARGGITRTFQSLELFDDLTVRENLLAASDGRSQWRWLSDPFWCPRRVLDGQAAQAVRILELEPDLDRLPTDLPYGRRRLLSIARAVSTSPSVLLLDEPAAGLDDVESRELATLIRRLADESGLAILLVEHDMEVVMSICDRVTVLDAGRTIASGTPQEIQRDPAVMAAYLGVLADPEEIAGESGADGSLVAPSDGCTRDEVPL